MHFMKSFLSLLTAKQTRSYTYLQILFLITAVVQVAGVASIAPFIALLSNTQLIHNNKIIDFIYTALGFDSDYTFLVFFALLIMALIIISNAIAAFSTWRLFKFSVDIGADLQNRIYNNYIHNDFVFFSKNNSSRLIAIITLEVPRFVYMVAQPFLNLTSQLLVAVIIVSGLFYVDFILATISIFIVGGIYIFIFKILRVRLAGHGEKLTKLNKEKLKILNESLGGIKEVKLLGTETWYAKQFIANNSKGNISSAFIGLSGDLPRFIVETITFIAILCLALYLINRYGNSSNVISILSLYAMAGYKLLPAMQTLYKSFSQIKANGGVVEELLSELAESALHVSLSSNVSEILFRSHSVELKDVYYRYPGSTTNALNGVSLTIPTNTMVAFVGASGAGKSTAVDVILGLLYPDKGELLVDGIAINKSNARNWQQHIGYVPQNIYMLDDTFTNNIAFGVPKDKIDHERVVAAAKMANIDEFINSRLGKYDFIVGERGAQLSGGQKQRIGIARALYHDTNVLILDEATSALDSITESQIMNEITSLTKSRTVIVIAHRLSTVIHANNVIFFDEGKVSGQGTFQELRKHNHKFDELARLGLDG